VYLIDDIARVIIGTFIQRSGNVMVDSLVYDSRKIQQPAGSLFFALKPGHRNGHQFLDDAYKKGIRNFIVSEEVKEYSQTNVILVHDTLDALQAIAAYHRSHFSIPVIGITGSNGKTVVKEWLYHLLKDDFIICRSPRSFNSQIGVPMSVWQLRPEHTLAIIEAGISSEGEMERLYQIIQPTIGVLTNIGEAHSEGFKSRDQKISEKIKLFRSAEVVVYGSDNLDVRDAMKTLPAKDSRQSHTKTFDWGLNGEALKLIGIKKSGLVSSIDLQVDEKKFTLEIPFTDDASIENAITCCCVMLLLKYEVGTIAKKMKTLSAVDMRLQLVHSFNECLVVNDSYSNDITSLRIALDFLQQQSAGFSRTVILSEFFESDRTDEMLYQAVSDLLRAYGIRKAIVIGEKIAEFLSGEIVADIIVEKYLSTDDFLKDFRSSSFFREIILIKGARKFGFERIVQLFERKLHQTVLEVNLDSISHNLKHYQKLLNPGTKIMAMVKAFSYGSGGAEIAGVLQFHNTDYLGVAYADEGAELVKAGISIPVMVMNTEESSFRAIIDHNLEPALYSFEILKKFEAYLKQQGLMHYPVHLEVETGMNRLGFSPEEIKSLSEHLLASASFTVKSVFTHLAASEDASQDEFTMEQFRIFNHATEILANQIPYSFLKHIANSAAIVRHPQLQLDMVRLGIGMYGVEIVHKKLKGLKTVATLRSTIAQLKKVKKGASVSYNRRGVVQRDSVIATIRIGYADGYSRQFGNGVGKMLVKGKKVPVVGSVCMDMTMIDVTDIVDIREGDDVIIFGPELSVQEVASWINTISYELMTAISQRVKRIYYHE